MHFADFPEILCSVGPEAANLGNLLRSLSTDAPEPHSVAPLFKGQPYRTQAGKKSLPFPACAPPLGTTPFRGPPPCGNAVKKKRKPSWRLWLASWGSFALPPSARDGPGILTWFPFGSLGCCGCPQTHFERRLAISLGPAHS